MIYVVIEPCGEDWFYSKTMKSPYAFISGGFVELSTRRKWPTCEAFRKHLQTLK